MRMLLSLRVVPFVPVVAALLLAAYALRADAPASAPQVIPALPPESEGEFILHEWGTFTSYSGSDGVRMEFRPLVDNDLPAFVHDWMMWTGRAMFLKSSVRARQRMETPVLYFYTDRLREVDVQVDFPQGLLTEFYPPPVEVGPVEAVNSGRIDPANPESLRGGLLDWGRVTLIPESALRPDFPDAALSDAVARRAFQALPPGGDPEPELYTGDHYYFARNTDSALVHVNVPETPPAGSGLISFGRPHGSFFEKFLFYRGVGDFDLPLTVEARTPGSFQISNRGQDPLTGLILVQVQGDDIRFCGLEDAAPGKTMSVLAPPPYTGEQNVQSALWNMMLKNLLEQGLYEKEAIAMLNTWRSSWFLEEGTRLLYIVPRKLTDEILPLTVTPAPQETVRVLLGRMEILSSSEEHRIEELVDGSAGAYAAYLEQLKAARSKTAQAPGVKPAAPTIPDGIRQLGRFAEPALVRIGQIADDASIRKEALRLLSELRSAEAAE